ncbi:MAG: YncE family protein [Cyclobacteriaceae bacterium]
MKTLILRIALFFLLCGGGVYGQDYYIYVTAESEDEVALVKFDGEKAETIKRIPVGIWPAENEGPHGITVSPDGKYWYLSLAHGNPYGTLYKFSTETNEVVGKTTLGIFPASMQISKATGLLYCVNFNLHGQMVPSSVSVVDPQTMTEIKKITTGTMPHGSRISPDGMKHYSVAMMSGELFEINTVSLEVSRVLDLDKAAAEFESEHMDHSAMNHQNMDHGNMDHSQMEGMKHSKIKPTWVIPHPNGDKVYVAANGNEEVLEVDLKDWKVTHRFKTGKGPYNVEISPNGRYMVVTYKSDAMTGVWDLETKEELARINNSQKVSHGVAMSSDNRYAFISVEGIGGDPGAMDVIDLQKLELVSTAYLGKQAGGIAFWKKEDQM